jgi:hypothetical protein
MESAVTRVDLAGRRGFLAAVGRERGGRLDHYTDVLGALDPGIVPLVRAFDNAVATPIFSCEGHWERRSEPYVTFLVLPGRRCQFDRFLTRILNETPSSLACFQFVHRHHPKRAGNGPFIDWSVSLSIPFGCITAAEAYAEFKRTTIARFACYFRRQFSRFDE